MLTCIPGLCGPSQYEKEPETSKVSPQDTIVALRKCIETQEKRERHLEHKIEVLAAEAKKKLGNGDKKAAVNIMKKRKMYQMQFEKLEQIKMTLETQAINLESAAQTAEAFQAMTAGNDTMKKIRHEVGIDDVDDVMDDMQEEMQLAQEVSTAIGQPVDMTMGTIDDDDLMAELEQMDEADLSAQFDQAALGRPSATAAESMPNAPTSKLGLSKKEEDDLNRLQAELAF